MNDKAIEAQAARVIPAIGLPASRREPRRRHPVRKIGRWLRIIAPLLGIMLVLAGCQNQNSNNDGERRDGFYGGITGGWTRP